MRYPFLLLSFFILKLAIAQTVNNPIISNYIYHDSSMIEQDGEFYSFVSCLVPRDKDEKIPYYGVSIFRSKNLCDWSYYKQAIALDYDSLSKKYNNYRGEFVFEEQDGGIKLYPVWAPEIVKYKDKYLLFVSLHRSLSDTKIVVFQSDSIDKDFEFLSLVVSNDPKDKYVFFDTKEQIDPNPIIIDDEIYLVFGSFARWTNGKLLTNGASKGVYIVELSPKDSFRMKDQPTFLTDYYEGVIILAREDKFYLIGSNGNIFDNTYKLSYAISSDVKGPYFTENKHSIADRETISFGTSMLQTTSDMPFNGFGCPSQPIMDKNGRYWVLLFGHMPSLPPIIAGESPESQRYTFLIEIKWDHDGRPFFDMDAIQNNNQPIPIF